MISSRRKLRGIVGYRFTAPPVERALRLAKAEGERRRWAAVRRKREEARRGD